MYMIWVGRIILSHYFDTTFDEYCFTDVKIPCANFYMVSE